MLYGRGRRKAPIDGKSIVPGTTHQLSLSHSNPYSADNYKSVSPVFDPISTSIHSETSIVELPQSSNTHQSTLQSPVSIKTYGRGRKQPPSFIPGLVHVNFSSPVVQSTSCHRDTASFTVVKSAVPAGEESDEGEFYSNIVRRTVGVEHLTASDEDEKEEVVVSEDENEDLDFLIMASSKIVSGDVKPMTDPYMIKEDREPPGKFYGTWIRQLREDKQDLLRGVFRHGANFYNALEAKVHEDYPIEKSSLSKEPHDKKEKKGKFKSTQSTDCRPLCDWILQHWQKSNLPNVYFVTLYALNRATWSANTPELQGRKVIVTKALMMAIWEWWQISKSRPSQFPLTIQRIALSHAMRQNTAEVQTRFCSIFINRNLISPNSSGDSAPSTGEDFVVDVLRLLYHGEYARAIRVARLTGAKDYVPPERILLPLIALRYDACIQELLDDSPALQLKFIQLLDEYHTVGPKFLERSLRDMNLQIPSDDISTARALRKMAARYSALYQISHEESVRIKRCGEENSIRYYLYRWINSTDVQEKAVMQDYIINYIVNSSSSRIHLRDHVISVLKIQGLSSAIPEWWEKFQNAMEKITQIEAMKIQESDISAAQEAAECEKKESQLKSDFDSAVLQWCENDVYYIPSQFTYKSIEFISTSLQFQEALEYLQCVDTLGIDVETHKDLLSGHEKVTLMQLASSEKAFLFDMLVLPELCDSGLWKELKDVFDHPDVVKLGYGLASDLNEIVYSVSHLLPLVSTPSPNKETQEECHDMGDYYPCVDLALIDKSGDLDQCFPLSICDDNAAPKGLSAMCLRVLGKPLRKAETMSDWSCRPLRLTQSIYAALDAMCLVEIYAVIKEANVSVKPNVLVNSSPKTSTFKKPRYFS